MFYLAVVGGSICDAETAQLAEAVGEAIAARGAIVVCGGGGGVMEAAARGARRAGGTVLGILPGESTRRGNDYLSVAVATGMGEARNALVARTADAVIAVGGEFGTLSEIALALKMGKPVIGLHTWKIEPPQKMDRGIVPAGSASEAVRIAWELLASTTR